MKVLVTGATGFVGGHLVPALLKQGYHVRCLIRDERKAKKIREQYPVEIVIGDLTKPDTLSGVSEDIDYVIHLAAMGHVSAVTEEAYYTFISINEEGTKNLIHEFEHSRHLKKFIHFSSTAAMGPIGAPFLSEESAPNPVTPYQKSKRRSENIIEDAFKSYGFPGVILRPCMIYGPGGYGEFYKFCKLMKKGIFPKVGFGRNLTPLVYVGDVVSATLLTLERGRLGETYIIASDTSIPMDELHSDIMSNFSQKAPYIFIPTSLALIGAKVVEIGAVLLGKEPIVTYRNMKSTVVDRTFGIDKAKRELGYIPAVSFKEGIKNTIQWYKQQNKI